MFIQPKYVLLTNDKFDFHLNKTFIRHHAIHLITEVTNTMPPQHIMVTMKPQSITKPNTKANKPDSVPMMKIRSNQKKVRTDLNQILYILILQLMSQTDRQTIINNIQALKDPKALKHLTQVNEMKQLLR